MTEYAVFMRLGRNCKKVNEVEANSAKQAIKKSADKFGRYYDESPFYMQDFAISDDGDAYAEGMNIPVFAVPTSNITEADAVANYSNKEWDWSIDFSRMNP